jgi:hypothetical protein
MKLLLPMFALAGASLAASSSRADPIETLSMPAAPAPEPAGDHATPRLKVSYERFAAGNVDGSALPIEALHVDMYALSWRWLRGGVEAEAGRGNATLNLGAASVKYGMVGVNAGVQLPGRVTPFLEGHLDAGVLAGRLDGAVVIPGTTVSVDGASAATWIYGRGIDGGVEVYALGRSYVTASLGWIRTTWGSADLNDTSSGIEFRDVTHDSYLLKLGLGI